MIGDQSMDLLLGSNKTSDESYSEHAKKFLDQTAQLEDNHPSDDAAHDPRYLDSK
jgi:hypothetical protein